MPQLRPEFLAGSAPSQTSSCECCRSGGQMATPLLLVLVVIEATDVVFAVNSIPAAFPRPRRDPFIVYTSNIFATAASSSMWAASGV